MNDLVTPSKHRTTVELSPGNAELEATRIRSIINGDGLSIPSGGATTNGDLDFVGAAEPNQFAEILDHYIPVHDPVRVDATGHFSAKLLHQKQGLHVYSVKTTDGQQSAPWDIYVNVHEAVSIDSVYGPDGTPIGNGQETYHNELNFIGVGTPGKVLDLVSNGTILDRLNVGPNGHWSTNLKNLSTGTQNFIALETDGQQSSPWRVLIKQPAPIAIQFVIGNESFQLIGNGNSTTDRTVTLVGTANPGETGWIADYHRDLVPFAANDKGVYFATVEDLEENIVHTFRLRSDQGRTSSPWYIKVISSKLG